MGQSPRRGVDVMKRYLAYEACIFVTAGQSFGANEPLEQSGRHAEATNEGITLSLTLPEKLLSGQAITLVVKVKNQSQEAIDYNVTFKYDDFHPELLDSEGKAVPLTRFGKNLRSELNLGGDEMLMELEPGKEFEATLNLARMFDLSLPGDYELTLSRSFNEDTRRTAAKKRAAAGLKPRPTVKVTISKFAFNFRDGRD